MSITPASKDKDLTFISTSLPQLDRILGGGVPIGRISVFTGSYSVGKTTLAMFVIREAQKAGIKCLFVDDEQTYLNKHAVMAGIDTDKLELLRGKWAEEILDELVDFITTKKNRLIVLDSYTSLSPRTEMEQGTEANPPAMKARLIAKFFRKVKSELRENQNTLIIINHEYMQVMGVRAGQTTLAGGDSMMKAMSLWVKLKYKNGKILQRGDKRVGDVVIAHVQKTKIGGMRHSEAEIQLEYGRGFLPADDKFQDALDKGEITKKGNTYFLGETKLAVGLLAARTQYGIWDASEPPVLNLADLIK